MNTILVPTDYSDASKKAAIYALQIAGQLKAGKVILYNAYQVPPVITEPSLPAIPYIDVDSLKEISESGMKTFKEAIHAQCPAGVTIEEKSEYAIVSDDIQDICTKCNADLIVMGITGASKIEEVIIGSTSLSVMKHTKVPVIIVPSDNQSSSIRNVLLATDLKKVAETTPVAQIRNILSSSNAKLHVVNVYENEDDISGDKLYQQELLQSLLKDLNTQFHTQHSDKFVDGINEFVSQHNIDLIIAIPKRHGFFSGLFRQRHTSQLAFHTHVPLQYIHNEDL